MPDVNTKDLFVFAHYGEAQAFIKKWRLKKCSDSSPLNLASFESDSAVALIAGEGSHQVLVQLSSYLSLHHQKVKSLINIGVAGGLRESAREGACYLVRTVYGQKLEESMHFQSYSESYQSCFQSHPTSSSAKLDCVSAIERVVHTPQKNYLNKFAAIVDREAWACGMLAHKYGIPFAAIKFISDAADESLDCAKVRDESLRSSTLLLGFAEEQLALKKSPESISPNSISSKSVEANDQGGRKTVLGFKATRSQLDLFTKLESKWCSLFSDQMKDSFDIAADEGVKNILDDKGTDKEKVAKIIEFLRIRLDPWKAEQLKELDTMFDSFDSHKHQFQFEQKGERSPFVLRAKIESGQDMERLKAVLGNFSFRKYEEVLRGQSRV